MGVKGNTGPMQQNAIRSEWADPGKEDITVHVDDDEVFTGLLDADGRKLMRRTKGPCGFVRS